MESDTGDRADLGSDPVGERAEPVGERAERGSEPVGDSADLGSEPVGERAWEGLRMSETGDLALPALLDSRVAVPDCSEGKLSVSQIEGCFCKKNCYIM